MPELPEVGRVYGEGVDAHTVLSVDKRSWGTFVSYRRIHNGRLSTRRLSSWQAWQVQARAAQPDPKDARIAELEAENKRLRLGLTETKEHLSQISYEDLSWSAQQRVEEARNATHAAIAQRDGGEG